MVLQGYFVYLYKDDRELFTDFLYNDICILVIIVAGVVFK